MAAGLDQIGSAMFSSRMLVPWHSHPNCKVINSVDNIADGIVLAGQNWEVSKEQLYTKDGKAVDSYALIRSDNNEVLGAGVGAYYTPLQNKEAFAWFQPFLDAKQVSLETAGALHGGQKVWILAKLARNNEEIIPGDEIEKYLMLSNSHDGTTAVRVGFTPIRVVCANTLAAAHGDLTSKLIRIKHHRGVVSALDAIKETVDAIDGEFKATAEQYRALAHKEINSRDLEEYVKTVFEMEPKEGKAELSTRSQNILNEILESHNQRLTIGAQLVQANQEHEQVSQQLESNLLEQVVDNFENKKNEGIAGTTLWSAYNAVTEYLNHKRGHNVDTRLNSLWFGQSAQTNQKAMTTALSLLG